MEHLRPLSCCSSQEKVTLRHISDHYPMEVKHGDKLTVTRVPSSCEGQMLEFCRDKRHVAGEAGQGLAGLPICQSQL